MKVPIGIGLGTTTVEPEALAEVVEPLVDHGLMVVKYSNTLSTQQVGRV
jgi:hypothetical protein